MRRLVLFLLLFVLGLAILLWIDRSTGDVRPLPEPVTPGPAAEAAAGEEVVVPDEAGHQTRIASSGPIDVVENDPDTGVKRYHLTVRDHRSIGEGAIDGEDLELDLFDATGEAVDRSVQGRYANLRLEVGDGELRIDEDFPITLQIVEAHLLQGLQFAPLKLTVPVVRVLAGDRSMRSAEAVELSGRGLSATGRGLFVDGSAELLRLEQEPVVELELEGGGKATLTAAGPLTFANRGDLQPDLVEVLAEGGTHLVLEGPTPLDVTSRTVRLYGRIQRDPDRFVPLRAEAEGDVVLRPADGTFRGDRARLDFDAQARPKSATLSGHPRIELQLRDVDLPGGARPPDEARSEEGVLPIEGDGQGELVLSFGARASFELEGPARLSLPTLGATLESRGPILGAREEAASYATLSASDDVRVRTPESTLHTESLQVEALPAPDGEVYARMTTRGATRAEGILARGQRPFELTASEGLVYVRRGDSFEVPRAGGVELVVGGEQAFRARARTLRDLIGETLAFVAEGDVFLEHALGTGAGARLVAHHREHAELFGAPGAPARFVHEAGELAAGRIELRPTRLFAQEDVVAVVQVDQLDAELRSRWVSIDPAPGPLSARLGADWILDAGGDVHAQVLTADAQHDLSAEHLRLLAAELPGAQPSTRRLEPAGLEATGNVEADYRAEFRLHARGEHLELRREGTARLTPAEGRRLHVEGELPARDLRFTLDAQTLEYGPRRLEAEGAIVEVDGLELPPLGAELVAERPRLRAVSGYMLFDESSLLFGEGAFISRLDDTVESWSLEADKVLLVASPPDGAGTTPSQRAAPPQALPLEGPLDELYAWGGFVARTADGLSLSGGRLHVSRTEDRVFATGAPARLGARGLAWESDWFELDGSTRSIRAGGGAVRPTGQQPRDDWVLRYESLEPITTLDTTIQVLREPRIESGGAQLRASWALFWVDPRRWRALAGDPAGALPPAAPAEERARPRMQSLFGELDRLQEIDWLREVYLEGNIEYSIAGDIRARAESIYVDLVDGKGWVRKIDLRAQMPYTSRQTPMKVRAEWLRHTADGSYRAENAVATTCGFEEPHYVIRIGSLTIEPRKVQRIVRDPQTGEERIEEVFGGWSVQARRNRLTLWRDVGLPLPRIGFPVTEEYEVDTESVSVFGMRPLSFGNDAKFGTFVGTSFSLDLSWLARALDRLLVGGGKLPSLESGKADLDARWLDDRGALLGLTVPFASPGRYWIDAMVDGLFDTGSDKGLVQVPEDERSDWRGWYRTRGRFFLGEREWLDVVATYQSDPGVQAEFFEGDFQRFEERETYLHWRRAEGDTYASATLEAYLEDFRTEVVEQPSLSYFDGRSKVASLGSLPLYYGSRTSAGYYQLKEGNPLYEPPPLGWPGEREVLRLDSDHRLDLPVDLDLLGLRATPWLEGRFTAWDEGLDADQQPARAGLLAGLELATTFLRAFGGGSRHAWTPSVGVRTDLATADDDVALVPIDEVETPLEGTFLDLGLRSLWTSADQDSLDIGLSWSRAGDVAAGQPEGWLPISTRSTWLSTWFGFPYVVSHDGRYDLESGDTAYSRAQVGFRPLPPVDVEIAHHFGRDPFTDEKLYDAASVGARYRFTRKWELEGRQTFSNTGDGRLASQFLVRRLGHDFVFEIETRFVAGEGESFGFEITPLLLWKSRGFGLLDGYLRRAD